MILALGIAVLVRARLSSVSVLFSSVTLLAALWLGCFALMYESHNAVDALNFARAAAFFALLIPPAVVHFSVVYAGRDQSMRPLVTFAWIVCVALSVAAGTSSFFTPGVMKTEWGYYPTGHRYNLALVVIYAVLLSLALRMLSRAAEAAEGEARDRVQALIRAFAIGSLSFVDFFPTIGVPVYPLGFLAILAFTGVAADAIWRYQLVRLTPEFAASQILATMKGPVVVVDMRSQIRVINRAALRMLGYDDNADLVGKDLREIVETDDEDSTSDRLMQSSGMIDLQMVWRGSDGSHVDVLVASSFVRASDGVPVGIVYAATDVTERRRAEQALRESEHRYRTLFEGNPLPMWIYDYETLRFLAVNDAAVQAYLYSKDEFLKMTIEDIRPLEDIESLRSALADVRTQTLRRPSRHRRKDGTILEVEISSFEFVSGGRRTRLVIAADVTERRRADLKLRESEERYRQLFEQNLAGVFRTTTDGRILEVNDAMLRMFGWTREELPGITAMDVYFDTEDRKHLMTRLLQQRSLSNIEVRMKRKDGAAVWALENMMLREGPDGEVIEGTIIDITDRKAAQDQIEFQAYHDTLTGLPNRLLFRDRIGVALAHARRTKRSAAVMFLDLDQFKLVNDTLGHTVGDGLLHAVAERLVRCVRAEDTVARMGGDECTILLADLNDSRAASTVATKILETISTPIVVEHHELFITTSIGIALFPDDGDDAEALLKSADRAMYRAKEMGRNNYQFATQAGEDVSAERLSLERSMRYASRRDEFIVHYQPMIEIASGRVVGAEALIRWKHPVRGMMQPGEFIPIAEQSGLILPMGEWVLRSACDQMKRWHRNGNEHLHIAVNLSARQFQQPDLADVVERVLMETGLPPSALDIEITESTAMQNAELTLSTLNKLKKMGVRISIDDFGTGYSSLSYMKRFPIATVKIDHDFVRDVAHDGNDAAIVSAIISMARALKLHVVAEGVEDEEQLAFLQRHDCEYVQGYYYGRPVPSDEFEAVLAREVAS